MTTILNEKTDRTVKNIHLMVTPLCDRKCPNCCNNLYTLNEIPYATEDELKQCERLFLTGGEPFRYTAVDDLAEYYKKRYPNIKQVIVYGNAYDCERYIMKGGTFHYIDGLSLSIKSKKDKECMESMARDYEFEGLKHNRLYVFDNLMPIGVEIPNFAIYNRAWQSLDEYKPADDSIFRKMC